MQERQERRTKPKRNNVDTPAEIRAHFERFFEPQPIVAVVEVGDVPSCEPVCGGEGEGGAMERRAEKGFPPQI